jgi:hypothetical protein
MSISKKQERSCKTAIHWKDFCRARVNIQYFIETYFPLYGFSVADFVRIMPIFIFVESFVYYADEKIEAAQKIGWSETSLEIQKMAFELTSFLKEQKMYNGRIGKEIQYLADYFSLETKILIEKSTKDFDTAIRLRSSDFRLLHQIFIHLNDIDYDKKIFETLQSFELLVESEEDVIQYIDDKKKHNFNSLAVFKLIHPDKIGELFYDFLMETEQAFLRSIRTLKKEQQIRFKKMFRNYRKETPRLSVKDISYILK